jgi:hypothetical protein
MNNKKKKEKCSVLTCAATLASVGRRVRRVVEVTSSDQGSHYSPEAETDRWIKQLLGREENQR